MIDFACRRSCFETVQQRASVANVVPSSPILIILMMEMIRSFEMSALTRATQHNIPEYDILLYIATSADFIYTFCISGTDITEFLLGRRCDVQMANRDAHKRKLVISKKDHFEGQGTR
jgi:hypothetical protein